MSPLAVDVSEYVRSSDLIGFAGFGNMKKPPDISSSGSVPEIVLSLRAQQ